MIPKCLMDYFASASMGLSDIKIKRFQERIDYVFEICGEVEAWVSKGEGAAFSFLDNIDTDIYVILGSELCGKDSDGDSTWLIHSSWASDIEISPAAMLEGLPREFVTFACAGFDRFLLSDQGVDKWIAEWGQSMRLVLDAYVSSVTADRAMGLILGMDLLLQKMSFFITLLRFNTLIKRY
ncbi:MULTISPECIES: hypothetical protein [Ralstonia solanacearum species complex]|nr:hypothetical protein [Ralstonia solanacearum]ALF88873.1 hypothetical protein RSUY_25510 [Ralstonia solanacearum]ATI28298.1 hypothetical protein CCY86_12760 [Ralstonia solanacearum]ATJ87050.1 hypothetical protein CDC59_12680 [Ralstonia solanacearum]KEI31300.1 hypothetical protein CQ06_23495 [Ralstonia solanacearum]KFX80571.1 hypothetical protein KR98_01985 [Ralstonia solanacearum]